MFEKSDNKKEKKEIRSKAVLLCPDNDAEAHLILKLADKAKIAIIRSKQPHGAKLEKELNIVEEILKFKKLEVWIVEIPGVEKEKELEEKGIKVKIIDHHTYEDLDRLTDPKTGGKKLSSLEQFLEIAKIDNEEMRFWGFDPKIVRGIGISDARYVRGLRAAGYSKEELNKVFKLKQEINRILNPNYDDLLKWAEEAWENREERSGYLIISSDHGSSMRKFISEVSIMKDMDTSSMIIRITNGEDDGEKISVQNVKPEIVEKLNKGIKGLTYTFGSGYCWGVDNKNREEGVTFEDVINVLEK